MIATWILTLGVILPTQPRDADANANANTGAGSVAASSPADGNGRETAMEGLWPSRRLMDLMLTRWADEVSHQYDLDDRQRDRVRELVVDRWGNYFTENRERIQPLANEFIEMRMGLQPPDKEDVQEWASRTLPMFQELREEMTGAAEEFREVLNPIQSAKLDRELLKMNTGMQFAENKLRQWKSGAFEAEEFWEPTREERRRRREERERERAEERGEVASQPAELDEISKEIDAWRRFVEDFISDYGLDTGQADAARSLLAEMTERALAHRDARRNDIIRMEQLIASNDKSDEKMAQVRQQLVELYGPIDQMFQELRRRLEGIPTTAQKEQHAERTKDPDRDRREERARRREERAQSEAQRARDEADRARAESDRDRAEAGRDRADDDRTRTD